MIETGLPRPSPEASAHSARLRARIGEEIDAAGGAIPFERFMHLALYAPGLGYYAAGAHKLGAAGDFVTAPEISVLFSRCLAGQVAAVLGELGGGDVLEVGAGSGALAEAALAELDALQAPLGRYCLLETSPQLRARQRERLARDPRMAWLDQLPGAGFRGVVLANELLDALPVLRFQRGAHGARELLVARDGDGFRWLAGEEGEARLNAEIERVERSLGRELPVGYVSELGPQRQAWVRSVGASLAQGMILLLDYGYPRAEYYHPQRAEGTLRCFYRHRAHGDPFSLPGLQDITAHVEYTALAEAASQAGLEVVGFTSQAAFLLAAGLLDLVPALPPGSREHYRLTTEIKRLTLPGEMGELVKVMGLARGLERLPSGFGGRDLRGSL